MSSIFEGVGIDELLAIRTRLRNRILGGSQTSVAIASGMADEFGEKTEAQLRQLMDEVNAALYALDPVTYPNDPFAARPGITRANFNSC